MKGSSVANFTGAALAPKEQPVITYQKPTGDIDSSGGASWIINPKTQTNIFLQKESQIFSAIHNIRFGMLFSYAGSPGLPKAINEKPIRTKKASVII